MKKILRIAVCLIMALTLTLFAACGTTVGGSSAYEPKPVSVKTVDLMAGIVGSAEESALGEEFTGTYNNFAVNLYKKLHEGDNELISPVSIEIALAMTANGAAGNTKTQMENVLFGGADITDFNGYLYSYVQSLTSANDVSIKLANSIWFKDDPDFSVKQAFLQTNADYYAAQAYKSPFDGNTLSDINAWVGNHTDGVIDKIIEEISKDAVMYLINALLFDAEWQDKFQIEAYKSDFMTEGGDKKQIDTMSGVTYGYLSAKNCEGFVKYYKGERFAFCAMLPNEGVSVKTVVDGLDGAALTQYFKSTVSEKVSFTMPKFKLDYSKKLNDALIALGMADAFNPYLANLTGLGSYKDANLFISFVQHKTAIEVTEAGTKAAAVTAVGIEKATAMPDEKVHYINLNRPFVYFILDTTTNTPLFMGTYEK